MKKVNFALMFIFSLAMLFLNAGRYTLNAEEVTITTYYPAPEGVYDELRAEKMAIGPTYYNVSAIPANVSLIIEKSVGIGTSNPDPAALLDLTSTSQGILLPRLTTTQRKAISSPPAGLTIYNTTTNNLEYYNNSSWTSGGFWSANGNDIYNTNTGNVGIGTSTPNAALQINGSIYREGGGTVTATETTLVNLGLSETLHPYTTSVGGSDNKMAPISGYATGATVIGGSNNMISRDFGTLLGGYKNAVTSDSSAVGAGNQNCCSSVYSTILGGYKNLTSYNSAYDIMGGGYQNFIGNDGYTAGWTSFIGGGSQNQVAGYGESVVPGGYDNQSWGSYSFVAGKGARVDTDKGDSFVWSDKDAGTYSGHAMYTFNIHTSGAWLDGASNWSDLAESMDVIAKDKVQETELVSLLDNDLLGRTTQPYDNNLIGVISSKRTMLLHLGSTNKAQKGAVKLPVALVGRCFVKVTNQSGPIRIGDAITSSSTPGIGMKADKPGKIVGYAMQEENFKDKNSSEIVVFINAGYYLPKSEYEELKKSNEELRERIKLLKNKLLSLNPVRDQNKMRHCEEPKTRAERSEASPKGTKQSYE